MHSSKNKLNFNLKIQLQLLQKLDIQMIKSNANLSVKEKLNKK